jgi:hypothetical protein
MEKSEKKMDDSVESGEIPIKGALPSPEISRFQERA